jgi:hypothetical protein
VKDVRFRNHVRLSLLTSIFTPVAVLLGVWLAHKLTIGGSGELFVIVGGVVLIQFLARSLGKRVLPSGKRSTSSTTPPQNASFLFYLFTTPKNCDALVGDLEERYKLIHKRFGRRRANFWYWTQVLTSVGPIAWAWAKKVIMKPAIAFAGWAVARGLVGHDSWLAALVELWKKVRS